MTDNYRKELVQVAAVCLAAAQVAETDTSSLGNDNEGVAGRFALERLLDEVRAERRAQELKWGTHTGETAPPAQWLTVIGEEYGEVAEEIDKAGSGGTFVETAIEHGRQARALLETR